MGGLVLALAIWQMRSGSVRFLHSYHYSNVPAAELPALARESGRWLAVAGASVALMGLSLLLPGPASDVASAACLVVTFVAIVMACHAIIRRNGSLFG